MTDSATTNEGRHDGPRSHEEATVESFRKDPTFAAEYLSSVLEDGDQKELMLALRRMSKAFGGVPKLAEKAKLNVNTLCRTLSPTGSSRTDSLPVSNWQDCPW